MLKIKEYQNRLTDLCQNNQVVNKLYFFGSALTSKFDPQTSDIDVLIEAANLSPEERGEHLLALWDNLEALFSRKVDLLTVDSLRNPYLKREVEQTKKLIYDRQGS